MTIQPLTICPKCAGHLFLIPDEGLMRCELGCGMEYPIKPLKIARMHKTGPGNTLRGPQRLKGNFATMSSPNRGVRKS